MWYKKSPIPALCLLAIIALSSLQSCVEDKCDATRTFIQFDPIYATAESFRNNAIVTEGPREMIEPGKIYYYNNTLLINEVRQGIHVYDNSNPENPTAIAFINIPGNVDMAIKENILYADNYVDLLTIDISDIMNPIVLDREEEAMIIHGTHPTRGYLVGYNQTEVTVDVACDDIRFSQGFFRRGDLVFADQNAFQNTNSTGTNFSNATGISGSLARFAIVDDRLYTIDAINLNVFDISNLSNPSNINEVSVGWNIETLFPYKDNLFVASQTGLFIFDNSNPDNPTLASRFEHAQACDPVYVSEDIAYVTLRDGNDCWNTINQLDVLDVSNIFNPRLLETFQMRNPHGLSINGNTMYLCEGDFGLKIFDIEKTEEIANNLLSHVEDLHATDVIYIGNNILLVIGEDGFHQYDVSDPSAPKRLSLIQVVR